MAGGKHEAAAAELRTARERIRQLEAQAIEARRQSEALQEQLEWHAKLLETQDRMLKPAAGAGSAGQSRPVAGSVA